MTESPIDLTPMLPPPEFLDAIRNFQTELGAGELETLGLYLASLLETNRHFNLTAITEPGEAWIRLIADSLALLPFIHGVEAKHVIDIGSGGGLPAVPLAIVLPDVQFTLVEATGKKAGFLESVGHRLNLTNLQVINERAETLGQDRHRHREQYDLALARALGKLPVLLELTVPFVKTEGHVLAIKGQRAQEEIAAAKQALYLLHCEVADVVRGDTSTIIVIQKRRKTPKLYPRRPGEPKRVPLG